ncbi:hypothetical protein ACA910_020090 [Epithemia clementina (nom. ined.)]
MTMLITGYTAALHGEELPLIDIGMIRKYWQEGCDYSQKLHVPLALVGCFKQTNKRGIENFHPTFGASNQVRNTGSTVGRPNNRGKGQIKNHNGPTVLHGDQGGYSEASHRQSFGQSFS